MNLITLKYRSCVLIVFFFTEYIQIYAKKSFASCLKDHDQPDKKNIMIKLLIMLIQITNYLY